MALITPISPTRFLPRSLLQSPGGFAWWYVDIVNDHGDGVVLIFSFGLPFLPGYANAARNDQAQTAGSRPSLNVAIYQRGELAFYSLQEFKPENASWGKERQLTFGDSTLDIDTQTGVCVAHLKCSVPGTDALLEGTVSVRGDVPEIDSDDSGDHLWGPLIVPGDGRVDLVAGDHAYQFEGDGYVDRNGGDRPIHDLGFKHWTWGRVRQGDVEKVYYILWPEDGDPTALGFEFRKKGAVRSVSLSVTLGDKRESFGGMPWYGRLELASRNRQWLSVQTASVIDNGPFYVRGQFEGAKTRGVFEWCDTQRIDLARHRFLVNMRVQNPRRNSMWVPLFTGPAEDRVSRLFRFWRGGS